MKSWKLFQELGQWKFKRSNSAGSFIRKRVGGILVLMSCIYVFGCSASPEPRPTPSKQEIKTDADRFFEKMEREKQGKPMTQQ